MSPARVYLQQPTNQGLADMQVNPLWKGELPPSGKFIPVVPCLEGASHSATGQIPWYLSTVGARQWIASSRQRPGEMWWALELGEESGGTDQGQSRCSGAGLG